MPTDEPNVLPQVLALRFVLPPAELPMDIAMAMQGKAGPPGGASYTHTQALAASTWTVAHNLGRRPSVIVADHLDNVVLADIRYLSNDLVQVVHATPITGFVYCN